MTSRLPALPRAGTLRGSPAGRPGVPADLCRTLRRRTGHIRDAVQRPAAPSRAGRRFRGERDGEHPVAVAVHRRAGSHSAVRRPGVRGGRSNPVHPPVPVRVGDRRSAGRRGAELAGSAGPADRRGRRARRPARGRDGLPTRGGPRRGSRARRRSVRRRNRDGRDVGAADRGRARRPRWVAVRPGRGRRDRSGVCRARSPGSSRVAQLLAGAGASGSAGQDDRPSPHGPGPARPLRHRCHSDGCVRRGVQRDVVPAGRAAVPAQPGRCRPGFPRLPGGRALVDVRRRAGLPIRPQAGPPPLLPRHPQRPPSHTVRLACAGGGRARRDDRRFLRRTCRRQWMGGDAGTPRGRWDGSGGIALPVRLLPRVLGVNLPVEKIIAFAASSIFVGMAGAVYGYYLTFIDPRGMFSILISVQIILSLLIGGKATLWGPVLGAFMIEPLNEIANNNFGGGNTRLFLFGGLLMAVVIFLPKGVLPAVESALHRRRTVGKAGEASARIGTGGSLTSLTDRAELVTRDPASARPLLEVSGLTKHFGGLRAVNDCSFVVPEGSITGLIGPNGSGKTTVFNLIDNTIQADSGQIAFEGKRIEKLPSWERAHRGLGRTFQITRLFGEMTVLENVVAAQRSFSWQPLCRIAVSGPEAKAAAALLEFVGMRDFRDQKAHALSCGQQKLVELAQILMLDPKLILLDEPAGGINPVLIERMGEMIRELNSYGRTFLIVEHNMPFVLDLCDPIHVLSRGSTMATGTPEQIQTDPAIIDAYLGDDFQLEQGAVT